MSRADFQAGAASYGRRPRRVRYQPSAAVCVCDTDTTVDVCPQNCPTRDAETQSLMPDSAHPTAPTGGSREH